MDHPLGPQRSTVGTPASPWRASDTLPSVLAYYDFSTLPGAVGSSVAIAADLSGCGNHLTQFTTGNQPTVGAYDSGQKYLALGASGYLSRSTLANGDWLQPSTGNAQPVTFIVAARAAATAPNGTTPRYIIGGSAQDCSMALDSNYGNLSVRAGSGVSWGPQLNDGQWHILATVLSTYGLAYYVDGYLVGSATSQAQGTNTLQGLVVGSNSTGTAKFNGDIGEAIVCGVALSPQGINAATKYLGAKW